MEKFTYSTLSGLIGKEVLITDEWDNKATLTVSGVNKGTLDSDEWESFSVLLTGDPSLALHQGTYALSHDEIGDTKLFMSPNSPTEYEIVITRNKSN